MKVPDYTTVEELINDMSFRAFAAGDDAVSASFWTGWAGDNAERRALVDAALLALAGPGFRFLEAPVAPELIAQEWDRLSVRITGEDAVVRPLSPTSSPLTRSAKSRTARVPARQTSSIAGTRRIFVRVAASVAVVLGLSFAAFQVLNDPLVEHFTPFGVQLSLVLPDSTTVELNANSRLSYRQSNPRHVWLDGEAFFHVKKKPQTGANFRVFTDDLTVEVMGTSFNVLESSTQTQVVLEEGSVKLSLKRDYDSELVMQPGELIEFSARADGTVKKAVVQPTSVTSWKDGILEFEDVSLERVMLRIESIYGWKAQYGEEALRQRKISTPLPTNDLDSALLLLSRAIGITIERREEHNILLLR